MKAEDFAFQREAARALLAQSDRDERGFAYACLYAIAREERLGRRAPIVTEPDLATWQRFNSGGRMSEVDFLRLLCEDRAVVHEFPFALAPLVLSDACKSGVRRVLKRIAQDGDLGCDSALYVARQAELLALGRLGRLIDRAALPTIGPHDLALELPGTGGQLAHHVISTSPGASHANVVVACGSWQEQALAGIVGLEICAPNTAFVRGANLDALDRHFTKIVGVDINDSTMERIQILWPNAAIVDCVPQGDK